MKQYFSELTKIEQKIFKSLSTPDRIQEYMDGLPINFEEGGETLHSPRIVLRERKAHCFEGALFALALCEYHNIECLLLDLESTLQDESHVVTAFKVGKKWGALSKTNHAALQYRDPVYASLRELTMSYFHEYFLNKNGKKTLRSYTTIASRALKKNWVIDHKDLWYVDEMFTVKKKIPLITVQDIVNLRRATHIERLAGSITAWKQKKVH